MHLPRPEVSRATRLSAGLTASYARRPGWLALFACAAFFAAPLVSQGQAAAAAGPADPKAQKTYASAEDALKRRMPQFAADCFHKADKQDGGHCRICEERALKEAMETGQFKLGLECADALFAMSDTPVLKADARMRKATLYLREGLGKHKNEYLLSAIDELEAARALVPAAADAEYGEGLALANLNRDADARPHFEAFLKLTRPSEPLHVRVQRFLDRPELVRARMTPAFSVTTLDGRQISLDQLAGKVVLIDFWATWCGPCKEALPRVRDLAKKFESQPFVVLSVSLDKDEAAWKDFVAKHDMTWPQYRDSGFDGRLATIFGIRAIPATFTVDSDGVLQDQHVGEAEIEGKIKKLVARAREAQARNAEMRPPTPPISQLDPPATLNRGATLDGRKD